MADIMAVKGYLSDIVFGLNQEYALLHQFKQETTELGERLRTVVGNTRDDNARYAVALLLDHTGLHSDIDQVLAYYRQVIIAIEAYRDGL
jgi:hypothetical protein